MHASEEEVLHKYKQELISIHEKSYDYFERQLSYISAGALGVSFFLIEKVFKDIATTSLKGVLIASWLLLGSTLFINLLSHIFTSDKHCRTIEEINKGNYNDVKARKRNVQIRYFNLASVVTLFTGILLFILYTSYNVVNMGNETKPTLKPDQTRGLPSSPPPPPVTVPGQNPKPSTGQPSSPPPPVKSK